MSDSDDELDRLGAAIDRVIRRRTSLPASREHRSLGSLSPDLLCHILAFCTAHDLLTLCGVARFLRQAAQRDALWEELYGAQWPQRHTHGVQYSGPGVQRSSRCWPLVPDGTAELNGCQAEQFFAGWRHRYLRHLRQEHAWIGGWQHSCVYLAAGQGGVLDCTFLGSEDWAVSCGATHGMTVWDANRARPAGTMGDPDKTRQIAAYNVVTGQLGTGAQDGKLHLWDPVALSSVALLAMVEATPLGIAHEGHLLAAALASGPVELLDVRAAMSIGRLQGARGPTHAVQLASSYVYGGGADNTLRSWDIRRVGCAMHQVPDAHWGGVLGIAATPQGQLVSGAGDRLVRLWMTQGGEMKLLFTCAGHRDKVSAVQGDECKIVSGSSDQRVHVWDTITGRLLNTMDDHLGPVTRLHHCGQRLLTGGSTGLTVWTFRRT
eukprot:GGOE01050086.1.p1 GENE.GGOE01050086.1~~GGOE01050086.1.p1  ORF type:complete len:445 (-),score=85.11 GGOE01050086.1:85-1386(-)